MADEKGATKIFDNLLFPKIFQTFRIAIHWKTLAIAFFAVAIICFAGWIMDFIFVAASGSEGECGVYSRLWYVSAESFHDAIAFLFAFNIMGVVKEVAGYFASVGSVFKDHYVYCIVFFLIKLVVISVCGGAICRIAALQFARGERLGLTEALHFSVKKFTSFFTAPLAPVVMIVLAGLCIFLLGLIGNIPRVGELLMGLFMLLALVAGALVTVILIGTIAGFNLMFPAIAYDDSDCFDAVSRSFSYIYSKPWQMGFYTAIAAVYGAICYMFVRFFAFLLLWVTHSFLQLGILGDNSKLAAIWPEPSFVNLLGLSASPANWTQSFAAFLVRLCLLIVIGLVVSFIVSFYFSVNTVIYSLMRNRVDNTALEDVYIPFEESKTEPIKTDSKLQDVQQE